MAKAKLKILPEGATPNEIRNHLKRIDLKNHVNEEGEFVSPITGETFPSYYALTGHIGAHLRESTNKVEMTDDRKGYIKAIREGKEPTEKQLRAHRDYMRELRRKQREAEASV